MAIIELSNLAIGNDQATANFNATKLVEVLAPNVRIHIPEGEWYFAELNFGNNVHSLPPNVEIFGEGKDRTFIRYKPMNESLPLFDLAPKFSRSVIRDLQLIGPQAPSLGVHARCTAIRMQASTFNILRDLWFYYFDTAVLHEGNFSGVTVIEYFAMTGCTHGIKLFEASNAVLIQSGRIVSAVALTGKLGMPTQEPLTAETGVGIDIQGTNGSSGPGGGSGIVLSQVTIEDCPVCLRIANSHDIVAIGCYFEPGYAQKEVDEDEYVPIPNTLEVPRKTLDIDAGSERVSILGSVQSEADVFPPGDPFATQNWTPYYNLQALEARGTIEADAFRRTGTLGSSFTNNGYGAATSGATAAHANHIRNGDMSRGPKFWTASGALTLSYTLESSLRVIGSRSMVLISSANSTDHAYHEFVVDSGVRSLTAVVRYRNYTATDKMAFRIDMATVDDSMNVTTLGFYSDTQTEPDSTDWRVRALTVRFDGTLTGVKGPRKFRLRLYPYNVDGPGEANHFMVIDSAWVVDGEYAAPYRPYQEGVEVLSGTDRTVMFAGTVNADFTAAPLPSSVVVPSNAVGMRVQMTITSTNPSAAITSLSVNDHTGGQQVHEVVALVSNRPTTAEFTLPLVPGANPGPEWSLAGASGGNIVTYQVVLRAWIYRL